MQERLTRISEEFKAANDLKREIESKEVLTENDKEELAIIENWLEEFRVQINEWAEEYNKPEIVEIEQPKEKTLKEQFDENRIKINEIKYHSKSLQPKFESLNKKNKHEVLQSLGFVETTTVDNRKIQIHPTLVGQYYDLVKEQRRILEQLKEEYHNSNQETKKVVEIEVKEEQIVEIKEEPDTKEEQENKKEEIKNKMEKNQQELAKIVEGKGLGKKDYIKHNGVKYWIPKKYINRFRALMHEQELLSKELEKLEVAKIEQEKEQELKIPKLVIEEEKSQKKEQDDIFKIIDDNLQKNLEELEKEQQKQLPILVGEVKEVKKGSSSLKEKIKQAKNKIIKKIIEKFKNTIVYKKYKEYLEKTKESQEKKEKIEEIKEKTKSLDAKKVELEKLLIDVNRGIKYLEGIQDRTEEDEDDLRQLIEIKNQTENELLALNENKETLKAEIKNIRKPKTNIKEKKKKNTKKIIAKIAIAAGLVLTILAGMKSCNNNTNDQPIQNPAPIEKPINNATNEEEDNKIKEDVKEEKEVNYYLDNEEYNITGKIYDDMYDASTKTNPLNPYFGENTEGFIVGWGITINDEMVFVSRSDANYKEKLENYLEQGGKVTTYAMSDASDGQINEITGFYNAEQISRRNR